ncbi:MAG: hypothetical protein MJ198_03800 [Bacteroidales bacterium]|nr:hypothetical protein [Bacteroidales bacterium]
MNLEITSYCRITNDKVIVNGKELQIPRSDSDSSWLTDIYHSQNISYPKFFKMDNLAKSGFLGSELTLQSIDFDKTTPKEDIAVVCCNRSSSLDDDSEYQKTIQDNNNYYPSPAVFVYTLANIVTGEISIRNKTMGESAFYIMEQFDAQNFYNFVCGAFQDETTNSCLCGWVEYYKNNCDVLFLFINRQNKQTKEIFSIENIHKLYK